MAGILLRLRSSSADVQQSSSCLHSKASTRPVGERVTFSCFAKRKSPKRRRPRRRALRASMPFEFARPLRGLLNVRPYTCSKLARIVRASLRPFLRALAAPQGPLSAASCRRSSARNLPCAVHGWIQEIKSASALPSGGGRMPGVMPLNLLQASPASFSSSPHAPGRMNGARRPRSRRA